MVTKNRENLLLEKESYANKGVSLIEMLAAVAVFAITIGAISGIFISAVRSQRRILATQELLDQTSYALEYMGRALRMAVKDKNGDCIPAGLNYQKTHGGEGIKFKNYEGNCQEFYLDGTRLKEERAGSGNYLTSPALEINSFNIGPDSSWSPPPDLNQPRVTISLKILGREAIEGRPVIQIQTSISQRPLDAP